MPPAPCLVLDPTSSLSKQTNKLIESQLLLSTKPSKLVYTLGYVSVSQLSIHAADIGLPQLAMHSSCEVCGINDILDMINLVNTFYNSSLIIDNDSDFLVK